MTIRKESKQYIRQQRKIDADLVQRPNEILKRSTDDGNLKLTFKSPTYYEKDIVVTKNAMLTTTPLIKTYTSLESLESFILDLEGQEIITYNLTQNTTITDVINYNNGMSYKLYLKQDEVGGKSFVFDETISNITLFDNFQIDQTPNSITQIKIDVVEDTLYVQSYVKYKKVEYSNYGSLSFTIDTTLGQMNPTPSYQLQIKPDYESISKSESYTFNYDFIVDWGDGTNNHIISADDPNRNHIYESHGEYTITISGLCEAFGTIANDIIDLEEGLIPEEDVYLTSMDVDKIKTVGNLGNIGLKDASHMFLNLMGASNITSYNTTNWDVSSVTNMSGMFAYNPSQTTLDVSNWNTGAITNMYGMFRNCSSLQTLDVSNWNTSAVTNVNNMFSGCESLQTLDVSGWDVSNVTDVNNMFSNCSSLQTLDVSGWDVSNVTDMSDMFNNCSSLQTLDVSGWDVSNVTDMWSMFSNCSSLQTLDVSNWDVSNVTDMNSMFYECSSLTTLDVSNWDVSNVTDMSYVFYFCSSLTTLDVSNWDVSNVTNMEIMFYECSSLTTLDVSNWDVSNVSNMFYMFYRCSLLTTLDVSNWNVSNVTDMDSMFSQCSSLTTLDVSNWDVSNVSNMESMFYRCSLLTTLDVSNWSVSNVTDMNSMFNLTPLDTPSYDALLIEWSQLPSLQPNIVFVANLAKYSAGAAADARQYIINTYGWSISDAGQVV